MKIIWQGKGLNEKCYLINNKKKELLIKIDKKYFLIKKIIGIPNITSFYINFIKKRLIEKFQLLQ